MKTAILWSLAIFNAMLLTVLVCRYSRPNAAVAQQARPSDYLAVPGHIVSSSGDVVFLLDTSNRQLSAWMYDTTTHTLQSMPKIDLDPIFAQASHVPPPRPH